MSLRRLFGSSSGRSDSQRNSSRTSISRSTRKGDRMLLEETKAYEIERLNREGAVKRTMDEEQFASGMPKDHHGLSDKIDTHKAGSLFKYAVITNKPSDERQSMLSRLRSFKPQASSTSVTLNDIPAVRLIGDYVELNLATILTKEVIANKEDYVLLDCIMVHFVPLDSFANDKSVVTIQVNDFRKTSNTVARIAKVDNTMGYNILFFLDYGIEKIDARRMSLSFTCSSKEFQEGVAWGAVKVIAQVQTISFPKRLPLVGTMGVLLLSDTDLENFESDPREIDLVLTPEGLKRLRESMARGEIENRTVARDDNKPVNMAKTAFGESYETEEVGSMMGRMKEMALLKERQEAARMENKAKLATMNEVDNETESIPRSVQPGKSKIQNEALKVHHPGVKFEDEIRPGESMSQIGDSQSQVDQAFNLENQERITRFAG